ncbi:AAA family ATPase [Rhodococcus sp. NPDC056506]|uniref:AAA family ATPase n=1 Tax=Rhodococcus sp. NPDC056506 TaxID=3345844 RepID=UPI00366B0254
MRAWAQAAYRTGTVTKVTIMVIDEADALVQSREATQMHHEDGAGVDAFLAEIDSLAGSGFLFVVMCTNRLAALDPAVKRRTAATFDFGRPDENQRRQVIATASENYELEPRYLSCMVGRRSTSGKCGAPVRAEHSEMVGGIGGTAGSD